MSKDSPKRIALVLNTLTNGELKGGKRDVSRVYSILTNPQQGMCLPNKSTPIHDCENRDGFEKILRSTLKNWDIKTQLVFYFSGHGDIRGNNNQYCLKMGVDNSEWYPFKNLMNELDLAGVKRAIIILDACHSGAAVEGSRNSDNNIFNSIKQDDIPQGIAIIASSRKTQTSQELLDGSSGVFTDIFCTGIETSLDEKGTNDGKIYVEDIVSYINHKLETEEKYLKFPQRSVFHLDRAEKKIWIAQGKKREYSTQANVKSSHSIRTPEELQILYEQTHANRHPCPQATIEDIDLEVLEKYANKVEPELYKTANLEEVLLKLKLYSPIQDGGRNVLHKSAVLCFHKRPEMIYPQARSVFVFGSRESNFVRQDILGPLSSQVEALVERVKQYSESTSYIAEDGLRREVAIDLRVARELISNAIAHRDYQLQGTVKVSITPEALEVYSPGRFLPELSWNQLIDCIAPVSSPVDEAISLYLLNLLVFEGIGRGFDVFKEYIKENGSDSIICKELPGPTTYIRLLRRANRRITPNNKNIVNQYKEKVQTSIGIGEWINKGREFYREKIEPAIKEKAQPSLEESLEKARRFYQEKTDPIKEEVRPFLKNEDFSKLEVIIHTASGSAAAASGALALGAAIGLDTPVLITIHIGMIIQLGEVFGRKLNKNTAAALLGASTGVSIGAFGVKAILGFIPFAGNVVNAAVSFSYTELLGWTFVKLFKNDQEVPLLLNKEREGMMEDTYHVGQAGAVGRESSSDHNRFYQFKEEQTLAEAAKEIQELLKQLEETNPSATEDEKIAFVNIATTPSLKSRVVGALQAGGKEAFKELLDNSYVNIGMAIVEGWKKPE